MSAQRTWRSALRKSMTRAASSAVARSAGARADWAGTPVRGSSRMSAPHVLAEVKDGIGWLTLNRPESLNALSFEMTDLLIKHTAEFEKDAKVRCVVIRGAGTHFMAGGDIKGFHKSLTENKAAHLAGFEMRVVKAHQTIYQIRRMQKPVLASVQGAAAGFGLSLILNCDLAIAVGRCLLHPGLPPYRPVGRRRRHLFPAAHRGRAQSPGNRPSRRKISAPRKPRPTTSSTGSCRRPSSRPRPRRWRASSPTVRPSPWASPRS